MQCSVTWKSYILYFCLIFTLTLKLTSPSTCWGSDMNFVSVETIQSQLWIFVLNLVASPGKWESVFSSSCAPSWQVIQCSVEFLNLISAKVREAKSASGVRSLLQKQTCLFKQFSSNVILLPLSILFLFSKVITFQSKTCLGNQLNCFTFSRFLQGGQSSRWQGLLRSESYTSSEIQCFLLTAVII